ncbi:MAG: hypothetical protein ABL925_06225 [Methylococcales bacterium]
MKQTFIKTAAAASLLLITTGYAGIVSANNTVCRNTQTLSATPAIATVAADLYRVSCSAGTGLRTRVDLRVGTQVQVQIGREGFGAGASASGLASDTATADIACTAGSTLPVGTLATGTTTMSAGTGSYNVLVNKTNETATTYDIAFDCVGSASAPTFNPALPASEINN